MATSTSRSSLGYALLLRRQLSQRNQVYARDRQLRAYLSYGEQPVVVYEPAADGSSHGNFLPASYAAIMAHPQWRRRLDKAHTQARSALPRSERGCWKELDSSTSSDALLMNIFCFPGVLADGRVCSWLGEEADTAPPQFGVRAHVPLIGGRCDRTEVDMRLGNLLIEAKLTETDFQTQSCAMLKGYCHFGEVFDSRHLPRHGDQFCGYQLIRNVLAAHANGCSFCVLLDARRPDLLEAWYDVMKCVKPVQLRLRLKVLTWQELSDALPSELQEFLWTKYGIAGIRRQQSTDMAAEGELLK